MGAKLLKANVKPTRFNQWINRQFDKLERGYRAIVTVAVKKRFMAPIVVIACVLASVGLMKVIPAQLAPQEDRGVLFAFVKGAEGTSYNRMIGNMDEVERRLLPMLGQGVLKSVSIQSPAFGGRAGDQTGFVIMQLEDWNDRTVSAQQALV